MQKSARRCCADHQLRVHYQAQGKPEPKEYVINLLGLVEHGAAQYLVVNFEGREAERIIALHRIHKAEMLPTKTNKPKDFDLTPTSPAAHSVLAATRQRSRLFCAFIAVQGFI